MSAAAPFDLQLWTSLRLAEVEAALSHWVAEEAPEAEPDDLAEAIEAGVDPAAAMTVDIADDAERRRIDHHAIIVLTRPGEKLHDDAAAHQIGRADF